MFGRMTATPIVRLDAGKTLEVAVGELLAATEYPQIVRWIRFHSAAFGRPAAAGAKRTMWCA